MNSSIYSKHNTRFRKRSLIMFVTLSCLVLFTFGQSPESADKVIANAKAIAVRQNKNIFVIFHASWCGWCHQMDTAMNDPQIKQYFDDNYVIRHLVVLESKNKKHLENPGALELMKRYSDETSGIPFWLILDKDGQQLFDSREKLSNGETGDNVGCPASEKEVNHFINVLKASSKINEDGLLAIRKRFRKIETRI
ncbi:thioredoxin family protein [Flavitalea antarctica]